MYDTLLYIPVWSKIPWLEVCNSYRLIIVGHTCLLNSEKDRFERHHVANSRLPFDVSIIARSHNKIMRLSVSYITYLRKRML